MSKSSYAHCIYMTVCFQLSFLESHVTQACLKPANVVEDDLNP